MLSSVCMSIDLTLLNLLLTGSTSCGHCKIDFSVEEGNQKLTLGERNNQRYTIP
jgi:hypothetical protein